MVGRIDNSPSQPWLPPVPGRRASGQGAECPRPSVVTATRVSGRRRISASGIFFADLPALTLAQEDRAARGDVRGASGTEPRTDGAPVLRCRFVSGQRAFPALCLDFHCGGGHHAVPAPAVSVEAAEVRERSGGRVAPGGTGLCSPPVRSAGEGRACDAVPPPGAASPTAHAGPGARCRAMGRPRRPAAQDASHACSEMSPRKPSPRLRSPRAARSLASCAGPTELDFCPPQSDGR